MEKKVGGNIVDNESTKNLCSSSSTASIDTPFRMGWTTHGFTEGDQHKCSSCGFPKKRLYQPFKYELVYLVCSSCFFKVREEHPEKVHPDKKVN